MTALTEEELLFRNNIKKLINKEIAPHCRNWEKSEKYPRHLFSRFGELGYLGCSFPETDGGSGGSALMYALLIEELSYASASIALGMYVHTALACSSLFYLGSDFHKKTFLYPSLQGKMIGCWAYAEPSSGSDVGSVTTKAKKVGNKYVLNGSKHFITNASFADYLIVAARTAKDYGIKGISLFIVKKKTPGLEIKAPAKKLGLPAAESCEIYFDNCEVEENALLGKSDYGMIQAIKVFTLGRIAAASFALGVSRCAIEEAISYSKNRIQFGKPLCEQQFIRFTLAELQTLLTASVNFVRNAARLVDNGENFSQMAAMAKLFATTSCTHICERSLHLQGANGYLEESRTAQAYRDCKVFEFGEGTSEIQKETIAREMGL